MNLNLNCCNDSSKLAIYCSKIMNDSTFAHNIVNLIYLKNNFNFNLFTMIPYNYKTYLIFLLIMLYRNLEHNIDNLLREINDIKGQL